MRAPLVVSLLLLVAGCVAPAAREGDAEAPSPRFAPRHADPAFAIPAAAVSNGAEPTILAASDGSLYVGDTSGLRKSVDGGATWQRLSIGFPGGFFGDGYTVAEDAVGRIYAGATNGQVVSLAMSEDGGASWAVTPIVDVSAIADRPWIAARGDGEVAFLYYDVKTTREACLYSTDAGATFLVRYVGLAASPNAGNAVFTPDGGLLYSSSNVAYKWADPCVGEPTRLIHGASGGAQIFTQIAVNAAGDVFVAGPDPGNVAMVLYGKPAAGGAWKFLGVSPPHLRSNSFGTLSVHGDEVAVAWYGSETPGDPSDNAYNGVWNVHVARVTDFWGAANVAYEVVTSEPNHVGDFCMAGVSCTNGDRDLLDYFGADHAADGTLHIAYGHDGATSNAVVRHAALAPLP